MKTRIAYGEHENGNTYYLGDREGKGKW